MMSVVFSEVRRMVGFDKNGFLISVLLGFLTSLLALGYTVTINEMTNELTMSHFASGMKIFAVFAAIVIGRDLLNGYYNYELARHRVKIEGGLRPALMTQTQNLSPLSLERPIVLDQLNKAEAGIDATISTLISIEFILANAVIYIVMITVYLCRIHFALSVVMLATFVPTLFSYFVKLKIRMEAEDKSAPYRRRMDHAEDAVCSIEYFKETRHLNAVRYFKDLFSDAAEQFRKIRGKEQSRTCRINLAIDTSYFLGFTAIIFVIYLLALNGKMSVGDIAAVIATIRILMSYLTEIFSQKLLEIIEAFSGIKNLHEILCTESDQRAPEELVISELKLENVSFSYPDSSFAALKDINLTIHAGETICVVGENGSGKSTLSKILLGLYPPTDGVIQINGKPLADNELSSLRAACSSVFQDYNKYASLSMYENVTLGSEHMDTEIPDDLMCSLPNGKETILSKVFGGVDLSQGQWQRIAIARGVSKKAQLIVFDEPTSAIDPVFEKELLEQMLTKGSQPIRIIITHRIGAATRADRVLVMEKGSIVQDGTHKELMQQESPYATLFMAQGNWYH